MAYNTESELFCETLAEWVMFEVDLWNIDSLSSTFWCFADSNDGQALAKSQILAIQISQNQLAEIQKADPFPRVSQTHFIRHFPTF